MTPVIDTLSTEMRRYVDRYRYDDFLYLAMTLPFLAGTGSEVSTAVYMSKNTVEQNGGGDCTQLSHHFARTVLDRLSLRWTWLVSSDESYDSSLKARLIPFRSTAIQVTVLDDNQPSRFYLGLALGHQRPIAIYDGSRDVFWGKEYRVETLNSNRFRLWTTTKAINRYREYYELNSIDFASAWRQLIRVKENYSITTYHCGVRHHIGYNVLSNIIFYTLRTERIRSKPLPRFLHELDKHAEEFHRQLRADHLYSTLTAIAEQHHVLREAIVLA